MLSRLASSLALILFVSAILSCRKNYSKEGNVLPEILQGQAQVSNCGACPFAIQRVELKNDTYFMMIPKTSEPGIICDWFSGYAIYDANGVFIDPGSDLSSRIVSQGKRKEIMFDCP